MTERIYSLETEYAIAHLALEGKPKIKSEALFHFLEEEIDPNLKAPGSSQRLMFLVNGAKFYDDNGHPEWSCPETRCASDAIIWDKAGERFLAHLGEKAEQRLGGKLLIAKNNLDAQGHFYGCHENYLVERKPDIFNDEQNFLLVLVRQLVPFLVTRQIFTGAGKVGPFQSAKKPVYSYQISQRAEAIQQIISQETRKDRAIFNTKDEALANQLKYRRLHLILGDSNLSEWASFMKLGTTGIVLRLIEVNFLGIDLVLEDALRSIREISYDLKCKRPIKLKNGKELTAIEIQRQYLDIAQDYYKYTESDEETQFTLQEWENALQKLEQDPDLLADRVDWIIKKQLLERHKEINKLDWQAPEVRELDIKYHDINQNRGLFYQLQKSNAVSKFIDEPDIQRAIDHPPDDTRAKIRYDAIQTAQRWGMALDLDWDRIKLDNHDILLDDPFEFFNSEIDKLLANGQAINFLDLMRQHTNPEVRKRAIEYLGKIEGDETIELLTRALGDEDWRVRVAVLHALGHKPTNKVEDLIKLSLNDAYFIVRRQAAEVLRNS